MTYTTLNIRGYTVSLDIRAELEEYDWGYGARWTETKLIAKSPFRDDRSPSFYVNYGGDYAGRWGDSGALDPRKSNGKLPSLIAHMQGISHEEACQYLVDKYGRLDGQVKKDDIKIPRIRLKEKPKSAIDLSKFKRGGSFYLGERGISKRVQEKFKIGRMEDSKGEVSFPWTDEVTGEIVSIKHRSTAGKYMYYEPGGRGINTLVYGLHEAKNEDYVVIVEGEIDAMSFVQAGINAVAVGTNSISRTQVEKIKYQYFDTIYLGGDGDEAGFNLDKEVSGHFLGLSTINYISLRENKDPNDILLEEGEEGLRTLFEEAKEVKTKLLTFD